MAATTTGVHGGSWNSTERWPSFVKEPINARRSLELSKIPILLTVTTDGQIVGFRKEHESLQRVAHSKRRRASKLQTYFKSLEAGR